MIDEDIRRYVIKHVEDTLKPKEDSSKDVTEILYPIEEESEDSKIERDEIEVSDTSLCDSELYAGFDEDGNRMVEDSSLVLKDCTATSLYWQRAAQFMFHKLTY